MRLVFAGVSAGQEFSLAENIACLLIDQHIGAPDHPAMVRGIADKGSLAGTMSVLPRAPSTAEVPTSNTATVQKRGLIMLTS